MVNIKHILIILLIVTIYIITNAGNNISQKISILMFTEDYSFYVIQVMNIAYVIFGIVMVVSIHLISRNFFTSVEKNFSKLQYLLIAVVDSFGILLQGIGNQFTPGILQTLLGQVIIPVSIILSIVMLKRKYSWISYLGALIVIGGIVISFIPDFSHKIKDLRWYSCIIYTAGVVFMALSFILKEKAFDNGASPYLLTVFVAVLMVPITFLIFPIQSIPGFGGLPITDFPKILSKGVLCTGGTKADPNMTCENSWVPLLLFCIFSFLSGVAAVVLTDKASAVVKTLSNGLTIPITTIGYSLKFIMGAYTEKFNIFNIVGIVIVLIGFITYSYGSYRKSKETDYSQLLSDDEINEEIDSQLLSDYEINEEIDSQLLSDYEINK